MALKKIKKEVGGTFFLKQPEKMLQEHVQFEHLANQYPPSDM